MNISYSIYKIQEQRINYDTIGPTIMTKVKSGLSSKDDAIKYIKQNGYFDDDYTILPIYSITVDDINCRDYEL